MPSLHASGLHSSIWVAGQDGSVEVRSMANPTLLMSVLPPKKTTRTVVTTLIQTNPRHVVAGLSDGFLRIFDAASVVEVAEVSAHSSAVTCMTVTRIPFPSKESLPSSTPVLVTGSCDSSIALWHAQTLAPLYRLQGNSHGVTTLCAAVNGCFLFSGSDNGSLRMWSVLDNGGAAVEISKVERQLLQDALLAARSRNRRGSCATRQQGAANASDSEDGWEAHDNKCKEGGDSPDASPVHTRAVKARATITRRTTDPAHGKKMASREFDYFLPQSLSPAPDASGMGDDGALGSLLAGEGTDISPLRDSAARPNFESASRSIRSGKKGTKRGKKSAKLGKAAKEMQGALRNASNFMELYNKAKLLAGAAPLSRPAFPADVSLHSDPMHFSWPIDGAHREAVAATVVVEDYWLVSVSRDTVAKVFGLPNGVLLRSLVMPRKAPLTGVLYDSAQLRLLVGAADGTIFGFDMRTPNMELALQVRPPTPSFSSVFTPIDKRSMHRLYFYTTEAAKRDNEIDSCGSMKVLAVASSDKTTLSHGPGRSFTTHRVGEPSLREINGAMQLGKLHAQVQQNQEMRRLMHSMGSLEEVELRDGRRCARTLHLWHVRRFLSHFFESWKRHTTRKKLRADHLVNATTLQSSTRGNVVRNYFAKWRRFCELIRLQTHGDAMAELQKRDRPSPVTALPLGVNLTQTCPHNDVLRQRTRQAHTSLAGALAEAKARQLLCRFYNEWVCQVQSRLRAERREVAVNRLLLSLSGPRYSSTTFVWQCAAKQALRRARLQRASAILAQWQSAIAAPQLRWKYWSAWQEAVRDAKRQRARDQQQDAWQLVEPLSAMLVRPSLLRARCFNLWRDYALYVTKSVRLAEEQRTMQREYTSLQNTLDNPSTVQQLRAEETELETAIAKAAFERDAMVAKEKVLRQDILSLRMSDTLKVLLTGFSNESQRIAPPSDSDGNTPFGPNGPPSPLRVAGGAASGECSRRGSVNRVFTGSALTFSPVLRAESQNASAALTSSWRRSNASSAVPEDDYGGSTSSSVALLQQVKSVLNAVKGTALQYARDEKQVTAACNFALDIPVIDPFGPHQQHGAHQQSNSHDLNASYGSLGSGGGFRFGAQQQQQLHRRQLSHSGTVGGATGTNWSVTVTSTGSAGAARLAHRANYSPRVAGGKISDAPYASATAASEGKYASLSEAFDAVSQQLHVVLCTAAREAGVDLEGTNGLLILPNATEKASGGEHRADRPPFSTSDVDISDSQDARFEALAQAQVPQPQPRYSMSTPRARSSNTPISTTHPAAAQQSPQNPLQPTDALQQSLRWLRFVSGKTRKEVMRLALQLVALHDSFAAHSEMSLETVGGGMTTRGATIVRALPLSSLCNQATANLLIRHAAVLLELLQPNLWQYQTRLTEVAQAHLRSDAVLVSVTSPELPGSSSPDATSPGASQHPSADRRAHEARASTRSTGTCNILNQSHSVIGDDVVESDYIDSGDTVNPAALGGEDSVRTQRQPPARRDPQPRLSTAALSMPAAPQSHAFSVPRVHLSSLPAAGGLNTSRESGGAASGDHENSYIFGQSVRSYSGASTPRSLTPRSLTPRALTPRSGATALSAAAAGTVIYKPFLGFRVNVQRENGGGGRSVITVKEIVPSFVNASGDEEDGPALLAGLAVGDELVRFAGYTVTDLAAFNAIVSRHVKPGIDMPVTLLRNGERMDTKIRVGLKSNMA